MACSPLSSALAMVDTTAAVTGLKRTRLALYTRTMLPSTSPDAAITPAVTVLVVSMENEAVSLITDDTVMMYATVSTPSVSDHRGANTTATGVTGTVTFLTLPAALKNHTSFFTKSMDATVSPAANVPVSV
ncbi:hypothetical protein D3C71_1285480 [compost metagenome]